MKKRIATLLLIFSTIVYAAAQDKYATKSGSIVFDASVPSFEAIKAENQQVSAILNVETGQFAVLALIQGFRFDIALMEEHFNENYMESEDYPKAIFKGVISDFSKENLKTEPMSYTLDGSISMHGEEKPMQIPLEISKQGEAIKINTAFLLFPEDFEIDVPKVVGNKIAKEVSIQADLILNQ